MRSFTFCTLLLTLSACGGDKGDETTETATTSTTESATATTTGTGTSSTGSEPGTTADVPTTGGVQSSGEATASTGPGETGGTSTGAMTTGSTSTGDTSTGDTSGSSTGDSSSSTGDSSTSTGGGTSELSIAIVDAELWANCQPVVDPDPVQGSWFVEFDNTAGAAATSAKIIKASLSLLDADPPVLEEIAVSPEDSGPIGAGEHVSQMVKKLKGAAHSGCGHCGAFYLLALEYQEGDVVHEVTEEVTISCAF